MTCTPKPLRCIAAYYSAVTGCLQNGVNRKGWSNQSVRIGYKIKIALKSFTLVCVGPVMIKSPRGLK